MTTTEPADPRVRVVMMDDGRFLPVWHRRPNPRAHHCSARITARCATCGRKRHLCRVTTLEIRQILAHAWVDGACAEVLT